MFEDDTDYRSLLKRFLAVQSHVNFQGLSEEDVGKLEDLLRLGHWQKARSESRRSAVFNRTYARPDETLADAANRVIGK